MRRIVLIAFLFILNFAHAYVIGGKYYTLVSCKYGQFKVGYEINYGYIGIYDGGDGDVYKIFFGENYCQY